MESFGSWSVLTTNFLVILYMAINGVTLASLLHLANAKWRYKVRFLACSLAGLLPVAFILLLILLFNGEATFPWLATAHDDPNHHLPGWHNYTFLVSREIGGFLLIALLYGLFIKYQREATIDSSYEAQRRFRNIALLIPFAYVLYSTMVAWDFEMTMIPSWHSASYGAYHFVSNFHFFLAFFAIFLYFVVKSGKLKVEVPRYIFNFLAQMMLAFTILWTYLYFTQYLIMWYGRLPEEMTRFHNMMQHDLAPIWWTFLACKFVIPFVTFATWTANRHNPVVIAMVATVIVVGTWLERYTWVAGSTSPEAYHLPMTGVADIVTTAVVFILGAYLVRRRLARDGLVRP